MLLTRRRAEDAPEQDEPAVERPKWVSEAEPGYSIKVKISSGIFHRPGMLNYERTQADRWYAEEADAVADGFRAAKR